MIFSDDTPFPSPSPLPANSFLSRWVFLSLSRFQVAYRSLFCDSLVLSFSPRSCSEAAFEDSSFLKNLSSFPVVFLSLSSDPFSVQTSYFTGLLLFSPPIFFLIFV